MSPTPLGTAFRQDQAVSALGNWFVPPSTVSSRFACPVAGVGGTTLGFSTVCPWTLASLHISAVVNSDAVDAGVCPRVET